MFKKVKNWLGIEGVKVELVLPEIAFTQVGAVSGQVRFFSKTAQTVQGLKLKMVEKYSRGRGEERLVDEYTMGEIEIQQTIAVPAEEIVEIGFTLPFQKVQTPIEEFGQKNILTGGLTRLAKVLSKVKSEYRIEAEAQVAGTGLPPFDKQSIQLK